MCWNDSSQSPSYSLFSFSEDLNTLNLKQLMSERVIIDLLPGELAGVHISGLQLWSTNSIILSWRWRSCKSFHDDAEAAAARLCCRTQIWPVKDALHPEHELLILDVCIIRQLSRTRREKWGWCSGQGSLWTASLPPVYWYSSGGAAIAKFVPSGCWGLAWKTGDASLAACVCRRASFCCSPALPPTSEWHLSLWYPDGLVLRGRSRILAG